MKRPFALLLFSWLFLSIFPEAARADSTFQRGYQAFLQEDYPGALNLLSTQTGSKGPLRDYVSWAVGRSQLETGNNEGGGNTLETLLR